MTEHEIRYGLQTEVIAGSIEIHDQVESTNQLALERGYHGAVEGMLILAERQTAGRGRHGRAWHSPHGSSLLVSLIFHHRLLAAQIGIPSLMAAVSIATAIRESVGLPTEIKWPNDVLVHGEKNKRCVDGSWDYNRSQQPFFVVGFGVNVNIASAEFPFAASFFGYFTTNRMRPRCLACFSFSARFCATLEDNYSHLKSGTTEAIVDSAIDLSTTVGEVRET